MEIVFDFDGVLVDSREVVEESYRRAGVEMPKENWGIPGLAWLPEETRAETYRLKSLWYKALIGAAPELPPAQVARLLNPGLLTGAIPEASTRVQRLGINFKWEEYGHSTESKTRVLRSMAPGIYIDDLPLGAAIARNAGWEFIRYWGQPAIELWGEIGRRSL